MDLIDLLQWPAMAVTILAAWLTGSRGKRSRRVGFWSFFVSNILWAIWGVSQHAYALVVLQVALALLNIRGVESNEEPDNKRSG